MTKDEIVEHFRELPFDEKCEVMMRIRHEFGESMGAEFIARHDETIARVCCNQERKDIWNRVQTGLVERGILPPCPAK
ncbi:MAG: hypothetical protein ACREFE_14810 [Limisphaerales bacterium]